MSINWLAILEWLIRGLTFGCGFVLAVGLLTLYIANVNKTDRATHRANTDQSGKDE